MRLDAGNDQPSRHRRFNCGSDIKLGNIGQENYLRITGNMSDRLFIRSSEVINGGDPACRRLGLFNHIINATDLRFLSFELREIADKKSLDLNLFKGKRSDKS